MVLETHTFHKFKLLVARRTSKIAKHAPDELRPDWPGDVQGESLRDVLLVTPVLLSNVWNFITIGAMTRTITTTRLESKVFSLKKLCS